MLLLCFLTHTFWNTENAGGNLYQKETNQFPDEIEPSTEPGSDPVLR